MAKEVAALDEILLRLAANGASADEIERQTGIPAAQAVMHIKKILQSRDIWTEFERRQLLLRELNELKESMRQNALEMKDPQSARLLLQTLQTIAQRLDSEQKQLDVDIVKVTEHQAKVMGRATESSIAPAATARSRSVRGTSWPGSSAGC
jgi:pantothenate synthetase